MPRSRLGLVRRMVPWVSLALGVVSALTMSREPERAPLIAVAAAGGWLLLCALELLNDVASRTLAARAARTGATLGSQSMLQLCLFFSLPFFARASAMPAHWLFVALLAVAAAVTLWTPLSAALIKHRLAGAALQAIATFAGLDCVLPLVGLSNRTGLFVAIVWTAFGLPLLALARRSSLLAPLIVATLLMAAYVLGAAGFVPPAPLRFAGGEMGTRVVDRRVVDPTTSLAELPDQLACVSAIAAPRGLRDRLVHVWRVDGALRASVPLEIRGGRTQGFRTWSTKHGIVAGKWTCTVETESGQLLGRLAVQVGAQAP